MSKQGFTGSEENSQILHTDCHEVEDLLRQWLECLCVIDQNGVRMSGCDAAQRCQRQGVDIETIFPIAGLLQLCAPDQQRLRLLGVRLRPAADPPTEEL